MSLEKIQMDLNNKSPKTGYTHSSQKLTQLIGIQSKLSKAELYEFGVNKIWNHWLSDDLSPELIPSSIEEKQAEALWWRASGCFHFFYLEKCMYVYGGDKSSGNPSMIDGPDMLIRCFELTPKLS